MPQPHKYTGPVMVRVYVVDPNDPDGEPIHDKTNDHNESFFRDWIASTEWWAMRNGKTVVKTPIKDYSL